MNNCIDVFLIGMPFAMAAVNIPFFPNPLNMAAAGICVGLGIAQIILHITYM